VHAVTRAAHPLKQGGDRSGSPDLHHEIDVADVDAELERRRRHEHLELAGLEALLGLVAARRRKAAVVTRNVFRAEPRREARRDAFGHLARVHEDEGRPVLAHELGHALVVDSSHCSW